MRRVATPLCVLLLVWLTAPATAAQPAGLAVTPDTLDWTPAGGPTTPFVVTNAGTSDLRLDSVLIGPCTSVNCTGVGPSYSVRLAHEEEMYFGILWSRPNDYYVEWSDTDGGRFPDVVLAPGGQARFFVQGIDGCPICLQQPDTWAPVQVWAGSDPVPVERTLAFLYPVAAGAGPDGGGPDLVVTGANPAPDGTALRLDLGAAADVHLALYDALGRRVRTLVAGPLGAGAHAMAVGAEGLSPGLYFARAVVGTGPDARIVTRRLLFSR